ncbi:MAG: hypothetical protein B7Z26_02875 [Asticcacaulis sp. 32-58-5]|nr:MAG: hypothetical protein B7Z26_02875 [Asticcacaulis sp. 32-58-5]
MKKVLTALAIVVLGLSQMATAVTSSEIMLDPRQDQRARALYGEVRCVVCQNEAIGDSQADIAADMRREIRTEILSGKTDKDIREGLTARYGDYVLFKLNNNSYKLSVNEDILLTHLKVKVLVNTLSTSIMGLLGRFEGNVMTWVRASNNKLIDRAARYIQEILKQQNKTPSYNTIVEEIFKQIENLQENEPIVIKVVEALKKN